MTTTRERNFCIAIVALSTLVAIIGIQNFDEYHWINVILAAGTIAATAIVIRWIWLKQASDSRSVLGFFSLAVAFWAVVWFWYAADFSPEFWSVVLVNSVECALLLAILYGLAVWRPRLRQYLVCFAVALTASCFVFLFAQHRLIFEFWRGQRRTWRAPDISDYFLYFAIPSWTLILGGAAVLLWVFLLRRPVGWYVQRRSRKKPSAQPIPITASPESRVVVPCPNGHRLRVPAGKSGKILCPVCKTLFAVVT